jgi:hypothetical protein
MPHNKQKKRGPHFKEIDGERVRQLAMIGCTTDVIALGDRNPRQFPQISLFSLRDLFGKIGASFANAEKIQRQATEGNRR